MRIATSTWHYSVEAFFLTQSTERPFGIRHSTAIAAFAGLSLFSSNLYAENVACAAATAEIQSNAQVSCAVDTSGIEGAIREIKDALPAKEGVNKISLVEIDRLEADDFWAKAAFWLSLLSLALSIGIPVWLFYRARTHSITDDYWIRQVGHAVVISPAIDAMNWHTSQCEVLAAQDYWDGSAIHLTKLRESLNIVPVFFEDKLAKQVYDDLVEVIARIEELVASFYDQRLQIAAGGTTLIFSALAEAHRSALTGAFLSLLRILKKAQSQL